MVGRPRPTDPVGAGEGGVGWGRRRRRGPRPGPGSSTAFLGRSPRGRALASAARCSGGVAREDRGASSKEREGQGRAGGRGAGRGRRGRGRGRAWSGREEGGARRALAGEGGPARGSTASRGARGARASEEVEEVESEVEVEAEGDPEGEREARAEGRAGRAQATSGRRRASTVLPLGRRAHREPEGGTPEARLLRVFGGVPREGFGLGSPALEDVVAVRRPDVAVADRSLLSVRPRAFPLSEGPRSRSVDGVRGRGTTTVLARAPRPPSAPLGPSAAAGSSLSPRRDGRQRTELLARRPSPPVQGKVREPGTAGLDGWTQRAIPSKRAPRPPRTRLTRASPSRWSHRGSLDRNVPSPEISPQTGAETPDKMSQVFDRLIAYSFQPRRSLVAPGRVFGNLKKRLTGDPTRQPLGEMNSG